MKVDLLFYGVSDGGQGKGTEAALVDFFELQCT